MLTAFGSAGGRGDAPLGKSRRGFDSLATRRTSDRGQQLSGLACFQHAVVRKPRLDELFEERSCEQVRPADLVEATRQEGLRHSWLAARHPHRDDYADRVGVVLEPHEELLCLVEATLKDTDPRQACGWVHTARALAGFGQFTDRGDELLLSGVDSPVGREDIGATRAAEREEHHVVVPADELLQDAAPLLRPFGVACPLAGEHQRAADVGECVETRRLAARRRRLGPFA